MSIPQTDCASMASASGSSLSLALTKDGTLMSSRDGQDWRKVDFWAMYGGFYKHCEFTAIAACGGRYLLAGIDDTGGTSVFESAAGGVWKPVDIGAAVTYESTACYSGRINAICCHKGSGQAMLFGQYGVCVTLSGCRKCTMIKKIADCDILSANISDDGRGVRLGLADGGTAIAPIGGLLQRAVSLDYATELLAGGNGLLVDVRPALSYRYGRARGSVNVPLAELPVFLGTADKQTALIFVCDNGLKAEAAVEAALNAGFLTALNAGDYRAFPYEIQIN